MAIEEPEKKNKCTRKMIMLVAIPCLFIFLVVIALIIYFCLKPKSSSADGIWTSHDWKNTDSGVGVNNGVPYGLNAKVTQRLNSSNSISTQSISINN